MAKNVSQISSASRFYIFLCASPPGSHKLKTDTVSSLPTFTGKSKEMGIAIFFSE